MLTHEKRCLQVILEWRPVTTNHAVMGDDGLKIARGVVRPMAVFGRKDDIAAFVADEVFVVRRNQEIFAFAETSGAAIVGEIIIPAW